MIGKEWQSSENWGCGLALSVAYSGGGLSSDRAVSMGRSIAGAIVATATYN
jgi:hypothetical protein